MRVAWPTPGGKIARFSIHARELRRSSADRGLSPFARKRGMSPFRGKMWVPHRMKEKGMRQSLSFAVLLVASWFVAGAAAKDAAIPADPKAVALIQEMGLHESEKPLH